MPIKIISFYILFKLLPRPFWDSISEYYSYLFEFLFCAFVYARYKTHINIFNKHPYKDAAYLAIALLTGFLIHKSILGFGEMVPFDLSSLKTVLMLIIIAPVLEELIFRMALWEPLKKIKPHYGFVLITTSLLFSYSHFQAYFYVPSGFHNFVMMQTIYTFFLALLAGHAREKNNSLFSAILVHFGFNLGFYLAG